jgi:hypothetical protein
MEEPILSKYFYQLRQKRHTLTEAKAAHKPSFELLEEFNASARIFLELIERLFKEQAKELDNRIGFQQAVSNMGLDEAAFLMFWRDQMSFYSSWLEDFDRQWYEDQERCLLKLSVKEMLMLLRLSKDLKLLGDSQLKQLFQFISLHFRTDKQEVLSYESLRKKYSQIDLETLRQVKNLLDKLSSRTNHYFALLSNK